MHNRVRKPAKEGVAARRARLSRESLLWVKAAQRIGPAPAGCHWGDVCDRGADTFEFLEHPLRHGREPRTVWALRVWEVAASPQGTEPLEWLLLSDEPIADASAARRRVGYYERRPLVEDYHKAQKTGLGVEQLQLQSQAGLQPLIALLSVLAVALVNARAAARDEGRALRPLTVREYVRALGRLGGHLNRKGDGLPGWQTLWRGAMKLHAMKEYELSRRRSGKL